MIKEIDKLLIQWGTWLHTDPTRFTLGWKSFTVEQSIRDNQPTKIDKNILQKYIRVTCPQCGANLKRDSQSFCSDCKWVDNSSRNMTFGASYPKTNYVSSLPIIVDEKSEAVERLLVKMKNDKHCYFLVRVAISRYYYSDNAPLSASIFKTSETKIKSIIDALHYALYVRLKL